MNAVLGSRKMRWGRQRTRNAPPNGGNVEWSTTFILSSWCPVGPSSVAPTDPDLGHASPTLRGARGVCPCGIRDALSTGLPTVALEALNIFWTALSRSLIIASLFRIVTFAMKGTVGSASWVLRCARGHNETYHHLSVYGKDSGIALNVDTISHTGW